MLKEEAGSLTSTYEGFFPVAREGAEQTELDTEIVAFETYTSEQEFERVHMGSPVIKAFLAQLGGDMLSRETTLNFLEASGKGFHTRGQAREAEVKQSKAKPYTLIVTITLKSEEAVDGFLAPFGELAEYVKASEPNTLTYEAYRSKNHPAEVVIFERYLARSDLVDVHMKSAAYQGFLAKVGTLGTVTGHDDEIVRGARQGSVGSTINGWTV